MSFKLEAAVTLDVLDRSYPVHPERLSVRLALTLHNADDRIDELEGMAVMHSLQWKGVHPVSPEMVRRIGVSWDLPGAIAGSSSHLPWSDGLGMLHLKHPRPIAPFSSTTLTFFSRVVHPYAPNSMAAGARVAAPAGSEEHAIELGFLLGEIQFGGAVMLTAHDMAPTFFQLRARCNPSLQVEASIEPHEWPEVFWAPVPNFGGWPPQY